MPRYFTTDAEDALMKYTWPGNVRDLENAVARAVAITTKEITPEQLPAQVTQPQSASPTLVESKPSNMAIEAIEPLVRQLIETIVHAISPEDRLPKRGSSWDELLANRDFVDAISSCNLGTAQDQLEEYLIKKVWDECDQNQSAAAEILGIDRGKLRRWLERHGLL